jgi:uncharacterized protein (TIGR02391 family)
MRRHRGQALDWQKKVMAFLDSLIELDAQPPSPARGVEGDALSMADFHSSIQSASAKLFTDGHYAQAVGEAYKALNKLVRNRTDRKSDDGTKMMFAVFAGKPGNAGEMRLLLNDLADAANIDEQDGFAKLMAGMQLHFNNVHKHGNLTVASPKEALEQIATASMLARRVDRAKVVTD